jgi:hypothetical protein
MTRSLHPGHYTCTLAEYHDESTEPLDVAAAAAALFGAAAAAALSGILGTFWSKSIE